MELQLSFTYCREEKWDPEVTQRLMMRKWVGCDYYGIPCWTSLSHPSPLLPLSQYLTANFLSNNFFFFQEKTQSTQSFGWLRLIYESLKFLGILIHTVLSLPARHPCRQQTKVQLLSPTPPVSKCPISRSTGQSRSLILLWYCKPEVME